MNAIPPSAAPIWKSPGIEKTSSPDELPWHEGTVMWWNWVKDLGRIKVPGLGEVLVRWNVIERKHEYERDLHRLFAGESIQLQIDPAKTVLTAKKVIVEAAASKCPRG